LCQELYENAYELDQLFPEKETELVAIKPLKKLIQFNKGIKWLLIMIRVGILSYAVFSAIAYSGYEMRTDIYPDIQATIYFLYLPSSLFLLVFTFVFLDKKWLIYSVVVDVIIIFGFDIVFNLLLFS